MFEELIEILSDILFDIIFDLLFDLLFDIIFNLLFDIFNELRYVKMNVLLNGAMGKMGNELINAINKNDDFTILCGFDKEDYFDGDFPVYSNIEDIKENVDVIIDFSIPKATFTILEYAKLKKIPIVIATTGFTDDELGLIEDYSKFIPIFRSSNMSLDINLMCKIVMEVAKVLYDNDIEIVETHHNRKVDSPSGTAIMLADAINSVFDNQKTYDFDRMQKREKRSKNEIGFSSIRGGNIVGEHSVMFFSENETFEITHKSYSRQVFAEGALKATKFLVTQKPGLYNMSDVLDY